MFNELLKKIDDAERIAVFNHEHPDGDALGSAYALKLMLEGMGKNARVFLRGGDTEAREYPLIKTGACSDIALSDCDLKIAVDCADRERLGEYAELFGGNTAAIDHHKTHVPYSDTSIVDADAAATGELIFELISEAGAELTREIAHNLYVALVCDTGSFKYSCTTPKTHLVAAELIKTGIDFAEISRKLFDTNSFEYLRAYKAGIEALELYADGRIAVLALRESDFARMGIDERSADGLVNLPKSIEGAAVGIYIREREDGYKVSLRSNDETDVAKIAANFGGGGHSKASGFSLFMPFEEAKAAAVAAVESALVRSEEQ